MTAAGAHAVLAHAGVVGPDDLWPVDAASLARVVLPLGLVAAVAGAARWRGVTGSDRRRLPAAAAGAFVVVAAVGSPLHALADALFAAHMVQHLLLVTVAAPLLVLGAPALLGSRRRRPQVPVAMLPIATASLVVTFTLWHVPTLYEAALAHPAVHGLEHVSMLAAAVGYWSAIAGAAARGHELAGVGAIAVSGLAGVALAALLALSSGPWYAGHAAGAEAWDLSPLADQQLGGMIMWIPGGAANLAIALALVFRSLSRLDPAPTSAPLEPAAVDDVGFADRPGW